MPRYGELFAEQNMVWIRAIYMRYKVVTVVDHIERRLKIKYPVHDSAVKHTNEVPF